MTDITTAQVRRAVAGSAWLDVGVAGFDAWLAARDIDRSAGALEREAGRKHSFSDIHDVHDDKTQHLLRKQAAHIRGTDADSAAQAAQWAAACEAADAATPAEKLEALYAAVEDTVRLLERAQLLPADFQHVAAPAWCETRIYAGDLRFVAGMTGSLDTPAVHYVVTSSTDVADVHGSERTTRDLNEVRAWLLSWAVQASQAAAGAA